jgi:Putative beta-barrel porin-2, OmpL-like. bbp2
MCVLHSQDLQEGGRISRLVNDEENEMQTFDNRVTGGWLFLAAFFCAIAIPRSAAADGTKPASDTAKPAEGKVTSPEPALTDRERWLLDQVNELKKRVADLESKANPTATNSAEPSAAQPSAGPPAASQPAAPLPTGVQPALLGAAQPAAQPAVQPASSLSSAPHTAGDSSSSNVGAGQETTLAPAPPAAPFSYADWTWLNGTPRNKDSVWDSKYFTPEFRVDTNFMLDYNQPRDHTMGGSTESFRNGEVQLEQLSFGGDLHVGNVRGRVLTMFGLFSTTTPRNDGSSGVGQWNLNDAYRYFSEAWGGYHFNVNHGLNIDAGIFVSYIGLFSYYNFDNWTYQPSFVSSNTPWFFNGVRIQWFPTEKLKIEPWIINGWQSYAKFNGYPGLGGQILWRPKPWVSMVFNNYGMGTDTLGVPGRSRIHTDDSVEVRYYNQPENSGLDKMAFSLTGDLGCEYGGTAPGTIVSCHNNSNGHPKQSFAGWMLYNRLWFDRDKYGLTIGGGVMDNPGRYLTLLPPINGASAVSGSPYFPASPGSIYKGWDITATFDWMPAQYITFRFETGYRHANVPYWTGRGGITPPGGNVAPVANNGTVGTAASYICTNGSTSAVSSFSPSGNGFVVDNSTGAVSASCATNYGSSWNAWQPDLRKSQLVNTIAIMVKF